MNNFRRTQLAAALIVGLSPTAPTLADSKESSDYYVRSRSYRTEPETDPPRYVRNLSKTGIDAFKDINWLDVGLDHRTRVEYRENDFRRTPQEGHDEPVLLRTRVFLGLKEIWDPFRFVVEFQDSRRYNSQYVRDDRDVNEFELIQGFGELYFKDALGADDLGNARPLRLRAGRMAFESLDRRLIARNEFRNTTNNFEGFRVTLGQKKNDWELDLLALQPVERLKYDFDQPVEQQWFYGALGSWRRWSDIITLQPYYLGLKQDGNSSKTGQNIHSTGLRGYGVVGGTGLDYDLNVVYQFGRSNGRQQHDAWASAVELGYTFEDAAWKPRLSAFYGYGTGDRNPTDNKNQRFNALFGFNQPWSRNDYFSWDNLHAPKVRLEFTPYKDVRVDTGYNAYWLASDRDAWQRASLQDPTGRSGDFLGHEFDIRVRYKLNSRVETELSYAHFEAGEFPSNLGKSKDSNYLYLQVSLNAFE
jgi:hypothetical protein